MINFTLYTSGLTGTKANTLYPNKVDVTDETTLKQAVQYDHVMAAYQDNKRNKANFLFSDVLPLDCDNDHSDVEDEWVTPLEVTMAFPDVNFAVVYSRNHEKDKGSKTPRPRFHVYFPIAQVTDAEEYARMKQAAISAFPYFDDNAKDAARFLFGTPNPEVEFYKGMKNIDVLLEVDSFAEWDSEQHQIAEGGRNNAMSHIAGKLIIRYGATDEAHDEFLKEAEKCNPPLEPEELATIWASAVNFGKQAVKQPGYIPPEQYNAEWKNNFVRNKKKAVVDCVKNLLLIIENDANLAGFGYNEMAHQVQVTGEVPWSRPVSNKFWRDADAAQFKAYIDTKYLAFQARNYEICFTKVTDDRRFHPIRDRLDALPEWDKTARLEKLFIDYLNADDTPYIRAVAKKWLVGGVARIYNPGVKIDSIPVLDGPQGIGKSTLGNVLAGDDYFCDSLALTAMQDKAGAELLQGHWIVEIGELAGMKKADIEAVKAFISRRDDKYRASYGRVVESHPRQSIIVATVNGENGYLRDATGNRRFWPVKCRVGAAKHPWSLTADEVDQIWAEAKFWWQQGEKLYLDDRAVIEQAEVMQNEAIESDPRESKISEFIKMLLPDEWDTWDSYARYAHFRDDDSQRYWIKQY